MGGVGSAELARDDLDARGNAFWRVEADGNGSPLPSDLILRVGQDRNGWQIERRCDDICLEA